jgi:flagellar basal body rod protein FlgG
VNVSIYQAAAAMSANARWQEVISENLASASIPGFKKQDMTFDAVQSGVMSQASPDDRVQYSMPRASSSTNFSQGSLRATGVNTDVAIDGKGFFEVQTPSGSSVYTRDGEFHVNASGQLVTKQGYAVVGEGGPIQIDSKAGGPISISATGEISQGADVRGKLKVLDFNKPELLTQMSGGLFANNSPGIQPVEVPTTSLRAGFLESANTSAVSEMSSLIGVMRSFEANQKIMQVHSERMAKTISELGNPN